MGQWPGSATNICLVRIMELLNGRAARCGSARVVELVAAWVGGLCSQGCAVWQAPKRCTVASPPDKESPLGLSSCTLCCQSNNTRRRCNRSSAAVLLDPTATSSMQSLLCLFHLSVWTDDL